MLGLLAANPRVRAQDLADSVGRDKASFKTDVRKLKALGLTISHSPGYELSPRGRALLDALDTAAEGYLLQLRDAQVEFDAFAGLAAGKKAGELEKKSAKLNEALNAAAVETTGAGEAPASITVKSVAGPI